VEHQRFPDPTDMLTPEIWFMVFEHLKTTIEYAELRGGLACSLLLCRMLPKGHSTDFKRLPTAAEAVHAGPLPRHENFCAPEAAFDLQTAWRYSDATRLFKTLL
jgi:hypothetical protein